MLGRGTVGPPMLHRAPKSLSTALYVHLHKKAQESQKNKNLVPYCAECDWLQHVSLS